MSDLVYKRKNGKYEARYKIGRDSKGRTKYGTVFGNTREEAIARRAAILGQDREDPTSGSAMNLIILGAGSYGREVKAVLEDMRLFDKIDFLDDSLTGYDIKGKCSEAEKFRFLYPCGFVAIGDNEIRRKYGEMLIRAGFLVPTVVSKNANVSPDAKLGKGTMVFAQGIVGASEVGNFCLVQPNGMVNAECKIGDYCRLDNNSVVLKGETVPEGVWIKPGVIFGESK